MKEIYVVNCCRTAIGSFGGSLKDTPAADLGAVVMKEALNRAGVKPEQVEQLSRHIFRAWLRSGGVAVAIIQTDGSLDIRELEDPE